MHFKKVIEEMMVHQDLIQFYNGFKDNAHPMAILTGVVGALSAFEHVNMDLTDPKCREQVAIKLIAKMPTLAAIAYRKSIGLPIVYPRKEYFKPNIQSELHLEFHKHDVF
jgi:citrate synthase